MMNRLMASKPLHPVITKLKAWRTARGFSQSQAIRALVAGGLPIKLGTLQQWERARSSPQAVPAKLQTLQQWETGRRSPPAITTAALERFLHEHPSIGQHSSGH